MQATGKTTYYDIEGVLSVRQEKGGKYVNDGKNYKVSIEETVIDKVVQINNEDKILPPTVNRIANITLCEDSKILSLLKENDPSCLFRIKLENHELFVSKNSTIFDKTEDGIRVRFETCRK